MAYRHPRRAGARHRPPSELRCNFGALQLQHPKYRMLLDVAGQKAHSGQVLGKQT